MPAGTGSSTRSRDITVRLTATPLAIKRPHGEATHSASFEPSSGTKIFLYIFPSFSLLLFGFASFMAIVKPVILIPPDGEGFNYGFIKSRQVRGFTRGNKVPVLNHRLIDPD